MHTVAVLSLKGGVGKTTVALGLASAALRRGTRTVVADLDPQGNATATLAPPLTEMTLTDVLGSPGPEAVSRALAPSSWGDQLDVLVSSEDLEPLNELGADEAAQTATNNADSRTSGSNAFARALEVLRTPPQNEWPHELAIVDCPPSLGRLTRSALLAADSALVVTEPTMYAVSGAERALEAVQDLSASDNPDLRATGVLVNRMRTRSHEHQYRVQELRETFGSLVMPTAIPDRLAVQQAQGACLPIHEAASPGARDIALTFNMVLAKVLRSSRAGRHRRPEPGTADSSDAGNGGDTGDSGGTEDRGNDGAAADGHPPAPARTRRFTGHETR